MNRFIAILLTIFFNHLNAQLPYTFYAFYPIAQSHIVNPSAPVYEKFTLGFLHTGIFLQNTPFKPMELFLKNENVNYIIEKSILGMNESDFLNVDNRTDLLFLGFKLGRFYFSAGSYNQKSMMFGYPPNLFQLAYYGNSPFQNQSVNLLGNFIEIFDYSAVHLGSQIHIKKATIGARIKLLNGIQSFKTEYTKAEVGFFDTAWTINTDLLIRSSGNLSELSKTMLNINSHFLPGSTGNRGLAFDLGISWEINDRLRLSAVIADIGQINWKKNLTEYYSSESTKFDGLNINLSQENQNVSFKEILDSITTAFNIRERNGKPYTTQLPFRSTAILDFSFFRNHRLTGILDYRKWNTYTIFAIGGQYYLPLAKWFHFVGSYTIANNSFSNVGIGFMFKLSGFQFYAVTDQVNAMFNAENLNILSFRSGINISLSNPEYQPKKSPNKLQ